jgi:hypothetical protein
MGLFAVFSVQPSHSSVFFGAVGLALMMHGGAMLGLTYVSIAMKKQNERIAALERRLAEWDNAAAPP